MLMAIQLNCWGSEHGSYVRKTGRVKEACWEEFLRYRQPQLKREDPARAQFLDDLRLPARRFQARELILCAR